MLNLTRRPGERIILRTPEGIEIVILYLGQHSREQARFGITAPRAVTIYREEVQQRVDAEGQRRE